jgi:hypothetical protein
LLPLTTPYPRACIGRCSRCHGRGGPHRARPLRVGNPMSAGNARKPLLCAPRGTTWKKIQKFLQELGDARRRRDDHHRAGPSRPQPRGSCAARGSGDRDQPSADWPGRFQSSGAPPRSRVQASISSADFRQMPYRDPRVERHPGRGSPPRRAPDGPAGARGRIDGRSRRIWPDPPRSDSRAPWCPTGPRASGPGRCSPPSSPAPPSTPGRSSPRRSACGAQRRRRRARTGSASGERR